MSWKEMRGQLGDVANYAVLIGAACILVALGAWLVLADLKVWIEVLGGVGILLLAATILLRPSEAKAALTGRQARYGGNAVLMSVAFLLILGLVNYLGSRHHYRWDVTEEKRFSLSEQSLKILKDLDEPVQVSLFFTPGHYNRQDAADLVAEYELRSARVTSQFIDPDLQRRLTMDYGVTRDGTVVFESGGRREETVGVQEQDFTSALLKVTRDEAKAVYFLTGHQELLADNTADDGYSMVGDALKAENYQVDVVNFASIAPAPDDIDVLVIAGPRRPLTADENGRVLSHVDNGGGLLVLVAPGMPDPFSGMLSTLGITLSDNLVIDPVKALFGDIATPLVDRFPFHQITKDLSGLNTIFPSARALERTDTPAEGWSVQDLATTSEGSWAETDYRATNVDLDADDVIGPVAIAAAVEPSVPDSGKGRVVVIGCVAFAQNSLLRTVMGNIGNVDLFMNAVNWLAEEESLISIRPKLPQQRQIVLTPPEARAIIYSNILFLPLIVLLAGALLWWQRR